MRREGLFTDPSFRSHLVWVTTGSTGALLLVLSAAVLVPLFSRFDSATSLDELRSLPLPRRSPGGRDHGVPLRRGHEHGPRRATVERNRHLQRSGGFVDAHRGSSTIPFETIVRQRSTGSPAAGGSAPCSPSWWSACSSA